MRAAELLVCERRTRLTSVLKSELRRLGVEPAALAGRSAWLRTRGALAQCEPLLAEAPASFVVLETHERNLPELLGWLARSEVRWPAARFAAVFEAAGGGDRSGDGSDILNHATLALREAGAALVVRSALELRSVAAIVLSHLKRSPQPERTLAETIFARLPWGD